MIVAANMPMSLFLPGFTLNSKLESHRATIIIGWYTFMLHLMLAVYCLDIYRGSASDWVGSPLFGYSTVTMDYLAIGLAIYSIIYMIFGSLGLIRGVKTVSSLLSLSLTLFLLQLLVRVHRSD